MGEGVSVVVPALNEAETLGRLFGDLSAQEGADLELIVADGGTADRTADLVRDFAARARFGVRLLESRRGRGAQMNLGAKAAVMPYLLFLHADTSLPARDTVARGLKALKEKHAARGDDRAAGHFAVRFDAAGRSGFYRFCEAKARTSRPLTVNGDQGFLLTRRFFAELGGYSEDLPFMEDAALEKEVRRKGEWMLLPGEVVTSARRFETEGPLARQTVNALMRAFFDLGRTEFLLDGKRVYNHERGGGKLKLAPFFAAAHRNTLLGGPRAWFETWSGTGRFVRGAAWQLPLMLESAILPDRGNAGKSASEARLKAFDAVFDPLTDNPVGRALAALLTMGAFYGLWGTLKLSEMFKNE